MHPGSANLTLAPFDAVLLLSFGGPEQPDDVLPFLRNVTRGRAVPPERLAEVAEHYHAQGGRSPINDQNRALIAAIETELDRLGLLAGLVGKRVHFGNRNWQPYLADALREAHDQGARRPLVLTTSAYSSYSGCCQYRENLADALAELAAEGRRLAPAKVRNYFNHPGFATAMAGAVVDGATALADELGGPSGLRVIYVTHSIPVEMNDRSGPDGGAYLAQHLDAARTVSRLAADRTGTALPWELAYCSRSGPPSQPWLEPDINDRLRELAAVPDRPSGVVVVPIGFISDHLEVAYDLDTEAAATAAEVGLPFVRAATAGTDPRFVAGLVDLLLERAAAERAASTGERAAGTGERAAGTGADAADAGGAQPVERRTLGELGPVADRCPPGCCGSAQALFTRAAGC